MFSILKKTSLFSLLFFGSVYCMESSQQKLDTQLMTIFSEEGNYGNSKELLTLGANPNTCDKNHKTPLYHVVTKYESYGSSCFSPFIAKNLLHQGAYYGPFFDGHTPLHHAVLHKDIAMCTTIISHAKKVGEKIDNAYKVAQTLLLITRQMKKEQKPCLPKPILFFVLNTISPIIFPTKREYYPTLQTLLTEKVNNTSSEFNERTAYNITKRLLSKIDKETEKENQNIIEICKLCSIWVSSTPKLRHLEETKKTLHEIQLLVDPTHQKK